MSTCAIISAAKFLWFDLIGNPEFCNRDSESVVVTNGNAK